MQPTTDQLSSPTGQSSRSIAGLPPSGDSDIVDLADSDELNLQTTPVATQVGNGTVRILAYSGSIRGPTLKVRQGPEVSVNVENQGDLEATFHWDGLRLADGSDGTHQPQHPMAGGDKFSAAPSERAVIDILFHEAGELTLEHHTRERVYHLVSIPVSEHPAEPCLDEPLTVLPMTADMAPHCHIAEHHETAMIFSFTVTS